MSRPLTYVTDTIGTVRTGIRRRRQRHAPLRVIPIAEATHRDIVLGNATVQLDPQDIEAIRELQRSFS